jgi:hypothetical protein
MCTSVLDQHRTPFVGEITMPGIKNSRHEMKFEFRELEREADIFLAFFSYSPEIFAVVPGSHVVGSRQLP